MLRGDKRPEIVSIFLLAAHYFSGAGLKRSNVGWKWKCIPHPLSIVRDLFSAVFKMRPSVVQVVHRQCSRIYFHNCGGKFRSPDKIILQLEHSYFVCVLVVTLCQKPPSNVMIYLCRTLIYHQIYICIYSFCYLPFPSSLYLLIQLIIYTDLDGDITQ